MSFFEAKGNEAKGNKHKAIEVFLIFWEIIITLIS